MQQAKKKGRQTLALFCFLAENGARARLRDLAVREAAAFAETPVGKGEPQLLRAPRRCIAVARTSCASGESEPRDIAEVMK